MGRKAVFDFWIGSKGFWDCRLLKMYCPLTVPATLESPAIEVIHWVLANQYARVAKLADARDLKSRVPKGTYRFDSGPGHQDLLGVGYTMGYAAENAAA
jgi:hypothetical protein